MRAFYYVRHRLRRLPDSPDRIARGIWAGVFTTFTPFFGLHFLLSVFLAYVMRGNLLASLLSTFVGNPLTFPLIAAISLRFGDWMLGIEQPIRIDRHFWTVVSGPFRETWINAKRLFTNSAADWSETAIFYDTVFFPYLVGGAVPGVFVATIAYFVSLPLIRAYKARRKASIKAKFEAIRRRAEADTPVNPE